MQPPETRYAVAPDGVQIAYQVTGGGDLDLVLMQGAVAHLELQWEDPRFVRLFERLSEFSRLIRFDRRGMGMSGVLDRLPTLEEQVDDFRVVMDAVGSERAAVMGTIDAGTFALAFAAEHPGRAAAVIAFETAPRFTPSDDDDYGVDVEALSRFAEATQAMDVDAQISIIAPSRKDDPAFRSWFRRYTRSAQSGVPIQAVMMMLMQHDIRERLGAIEAPVLVLHRTSHTLLPIRSGRALARAVPDGQLVELSGDGTAIFSADVDEVADEIQSVLTGTRPPPRHDRVLATVLFTDIVGSTDTAARIGDRDWRELLDRHHRLLRAALDRYGGREVHTAGDGFLATFDSPRRAIECARAAGQAVRSIGLQIRAGLHTGEIEVTADDIQGIAVHMAARVSALAGSSEVLVSSTVKDLVAGSGIEFEDRGTHELKGVPGEWHLYAVAT
ncbi:MAG: adenylate/guanylate cyclase domain-containing protein [Actinomycetota bacterium]